MDSPQSVRQEGSLSFDLDPGGTTHHSDVRGDPRRELSVHTPGACPGQKRVYLFVLVLTQDSLSFECTYVFNSLCSVTNYVRRSVDFTCRGYPGDIEALQ